MKRLGQFIMVFLCVLVFVYLQPIFFSHDANSNVSDTPIEKKSHKSISYPKISATGLATYIGASSQTLEQDFGQPTKKIASALGYDWWLYFVEEALVFQAAVRDQSVVSIFQIDNLAGSDSKDGLAVGQSLKEVTKIVPISSDFALNYQENTVSFELSERQMRQLPLISYQNEAFALLYFDSTTDKVLAIRYLDSRQLLELMPYHLTEGAALPITVIEPADWQQTNQENAAFFVELLNHLRHQQALPPLASNSEDQTFFQEKMVAFVREPEKIIQTKEQLLAWQIHSEDSTFSNAFRFNKNEMQRFLRNYPQKQQIESGNFLAPAIDIPWAVMTSYAKIENIVGSDDVEKALELLVVYEGENLFYAIKEVDSPQDTDISDDSSAGMLSADSMTSGKE